MKKQKIFIFGIDGATWDVIDPLINQGKLPNFKKFLDKGRKAVLNTTIPPLTPCAWTSFFTGKNPGKHGLYDFYYINENKELKLNSALSLRLEKDLWDFLSEKNMRTILFNVPMTYPPKKLNGIVISDAPDLKSEFVYPIKYKKLLLDKFPDYRVDEKTKYGENEKNRKNFFEDVYQLDLLRSKVMKFLLETEKWDFFMVHFTMLDRVQHWYWKFMDKSHPKYEQNNCSTYIEIAYQLMDKIFGEALQRIPKGSTILIMSDHGFGKYINDVNINMWLRKEGYLFFKEKNIGLLKRLFKKINFSPNKIINLIFYFRLGFILKSFSKKTIQKITNQFTFNYKDIDYSKSKAYSYGHYGPIYINKDLIKNKKEYEEFRNEIIEKLRLIKDPVYNEKLMSNIWKREELYYGSKLDNLPDIVFIMQNFSFGASSILTFMSDKLFSDPITYKTAEHRKEGIFAIYGPNIKKGINKPANIIDLFPTLLYIMKSRIPMEIDGKILKSIFIKHSRLVKPKRIPYDSEKEKLKDIIQNLEV
jgi:predicted AlkP superfamily phosphohydrolase/phosphomutase